MRRLVLAVTATLVGLLVGGGPAVAAEAELEQYLVDLPARLTVDIRMFGGETCPEGAEVRATLAWPVRSADDGSVVSVDAQVEFVADDHRRARFVLSEDKPRMATRLVFECAGEVRIDDEDFIRTTGSLDLASSKVQQGGVVELQGMMPSQTSCAEGGTAWLHRNPEGTVLSQTPLVVNRSEVTASVEVPRDAPAGSYDVVARCGDDWLSGNLTVELRQSQVALPGASSSTPDDPSPDPAPSAEPTPDGGAEPLAEDDASTPTATEPETTSSSADEDAPVEPTSSDADAPEATAVVDDDEGGGNGLVIALGVLVVVLVGVVAFLLGQRRPT